MYEDDWLEAAYEERFECPSEPTDEWPDEPYDPCDGGYEDPWYEDAGVLNPECEEE